jgi:hypothetical protein
VLELDILPKQASNKEARHIMIDNAVANPEGKPISQHHQVNIELKHVT